MQTPFFMGKSAMASVAQLSQVRRNVFSIECVLCRMCSLHKDKSAMSSVARLPQVRFSLILQQQTNPKPQTKSTMASVAELFPVSSRKSPKPEAKPKPQTPNPNSKPYTLFTKPDVLNPTS